MYIEAKKYNINKKISTNNVKTTSNTSGHKTDKIDFQHKLWLINRQVASLWKAFANNLLVNIKLSKTHVSKIVQPRGFLGRQLQMKKGRYYENIQMPWRFWFIDQEGNSKPCKKKEANKVVDFVMCY